MKSARHFEFAALAALASVVMGVVVLLLAPGLSRSDAGPARARTEMHQGDGVAPRAYLAQLLAMRDLHQRSLTATTPQTREAVATERGPVMSAGVSMMQRMRSDLPASVSATGEMTSEPITEPEAQRVQDFLQIMELLIEMKSDTEAALGSQTSPGTMPGNLPGDREVATPRGTRTVTVPEPAPERRLTPGSSLVQSGAGSSPSPSGLVI